MAKANTRAGGGGQGRARLRTKARAGEKESLGARAKLKTRAGHLPIASEVTPIRWERGRLLLLDQRRLPAEERYVVCAGASATARAIREMVVRGAPAIGVAAAYGLAAEAHRFRAGRVREDFTRAAETLAAARPTAVNLRWALERMRTVLDSMPAAVAPAEAARGLAGEAERIHGDDVDVNRRLAAHGARLLGDVGDVITHCNAGALATAGYGTALGVIRAAWESGRRFGVFATETRPYLQGARLTAWELTKLGIPVTLITDSMVGRLLQTGRIGAAIVGTDRTAANGDVANKVGTYQIAVLARLHGVPFYVAAPTSSIDLECRDGSAIPIEERDPREVTHLDGKRIAPEGVRVFNPAFDVTPAELVTAIVTEHGVVRGNFRRELPKVVKKGARRRPATAR
jgi:methylthioribose-1-phosphate isomerase